MISLQQPPEIAKEHGLSPVLKMHYNLYLTGGHTLMAIVTARHGFPHKFQKQLSGNQYR